MEKNGRIAFVPSLRFSSSKWIKLDKLKTLKALKRSKGEKSIYVESIFQANEGHLIVLKNGVFEGSPIWANTRLGQCPGPKHSHHSFTVTPKTPAVYPQKTQDSSV